MAPLLSGIALVLAFFIAAAAGLGLVVGLFRVGGKPPGGG